jgi:putative copper export protein
MTKKQRNKLLVIFLRRFAVIFTFAVLVISITGLFFAYLGPNDLDITKIFAFSNPGLPYSYIIIMAGIALVINALSFLAVFLLKRKKNRYEKLFKHYRISRKK